MRTLLVVLAMIGSASAIQWAYADADSAAVRAAWATQIPRVGIGSSQRGTIDGDSVSLGGYEAFTAAELTTLQAMFDSLGVAYRDSIAGFVPRQAAP